MAYAGNTFNRVVVDDIDIFDDPLDDPFDDTRGISLTADMIPVEEAKAGAPDVSAFALAATAHANIEREVEAATTDEEAERLVTGPLRAAELALCAAPADTASEMLHKLMVAYGLDGTGEANPIKGVDFGELLAEAERFRHSPADLGDFRRELHESYGRQRNAEMLRRWQQWRTARADLDIAKAATDDCPLDHQEADRLTEEYCEAMDRLVQAEAPNAAAFDLKIRLLNERYFDYGGVLPDEDWEMVVRDARRFAMLCEDRSYSEGLAA